MRQQPCTPNCPKRCPGCGATCKDWSDYVTDRNAGYEERKRACEYQLCKSVVIDKAVHARHRNKRK